MLVTAHEVAIASPKVLAGRGRERGLTMDSFLERGLSKPESMLLSELLLLSVLVHVRGSSIGALYVHGLGRSTRQTVKNKYKCGEGETRVWEIFVTPWQPSQLANTAKVQLLNSHVEKQSRHSRR